MTPGAFPTLVRGAVAGLVAVLLLLGAPDTGQAQCWACDFSTTGQYCGQHASGMSACAEWHEGGNTDCSAFGDFCTIKPPVTLLGDSATVHLALSAGEETNRPAHPEANERGREAEVCRRARLRSKPLLADRAPVRP